MTGAGVFTAAQAGTAGAVGSVVRDGVGRRLAAARDRSALRCRAAARRSDVRAGSAGDPGAGQEQGHARPSTQAQAARPQNAQPSPYMFVNIGDPVIEEGPPVARGGGRPPAAGAREPVGGRGSAGQVRR